MIDMLSPEKGGGVSLWLAPFKIWELGRVSGISKLLTTHNSMLCAFLVESFCCRDSAPKVSLHFPWSAPDALIQRHPQDRKG